MPKCVPERKMSFFCWHTLGMAALSLPRLLDAARPIPVERTPPSPGPQHCMVGSLQPILPRQEQPLLTGEACGCSI